MSVLGQSSQEFENILTVGSSDGFGRSDYSSYGYGLDILVPGGAIDNPTLSTVGDDLGTMAGTSASAAKAAGMASKVWESNPDLNPTQVIDILTGSAIDLKEPGWDRETGFGVVNFNRAIDLAKETTPQSYTPPAFITPNTWDGEGKVTPMERAAQDWNAVGDGRIKYVGWLDSSNPSDKLSFTVNQTIPNFQFGLKAPEQGSTSQYSGSTTTLYDSNGNAISTLSYNPSLLHEGLFGATPLNPGSYYVVLDKGSQSTIDPYEIVLNFTGLSGEVKLLDDTIYLPRPTVNPTPDPIVDPTPDPITNPIQVVGEIAKKYLSLGGENSWLGKAVQNQVQQSGGFSQQRFENGYIPWNTNRATAYEVGNGNRNVTAPSNVPTTNWVSPLNWKAEFINREPSNAADINFNIDRKDGQTAIFADIPSRVDVKDLGSQAAQWPVKAKLNVDFGLNSPTNTGKVQADTFGMLASTEVPLESGKTYKFTTKSDDGSAFNLKNLTTGQWIEPKDILVDPTFTDNTDWRNRSYEEPSKTVLFRVPQSGQYQLMFKLYDGTGGARIDAKVEEVFQDTVDISKEWQLEAYKWEKGQNPRPPADIQTATTAGNGLEYMGRVSAGSNTRPDGTKGTLQKQDGAWWYWGAGSPNHNDLRFKEVKDQFVVKGVTEAKFEANQTYKFTVKADDGYQLYARYQDGTKELITPENQWMEDYSYKTIDFKPKKTGTYKVVAYMFEDGGDAYFDLSWKKIPPPVSSGSYYPELADPKYDINWWNDQTRDNTRFDYGYPDYKDERYLTLDAIEQIYTDLSKTIFDKRYPTTAGYLLDPGYRQGVKKWHSGIDIDTPNGEPVQVVVGGTILRGIQEKDGDYFIGVRGDDGKLWVYGHLGDVSVPSGRIETGQVIGHVGAAKSHLHLEVQPGRSKDFYKNSQSGNQDTVKSVTLNPIKSFWELRNANASSSNTGTGANSGNTGTSGGNSNTGTNPGSTKNGSNAGQGTNGTSGTIDTDSLNTAKDLGTLPYGKKTTISDYVEDNPQYPNDKFKFHVDVPIPVNIKLWNLNADLDLSLIKDRNNNGRIDDGEAIDSSDNGGSSEEVVEGMLQPGDYYAVVYPGSSGAKTDYQLTFSIDFKHLTGTTGVDVYEKGSDYVQVVDMSKGASVEFLHSQIIEQGDSPKFEFQTIEEAWNDFSKNKTWAFSVTNGQYYIEPPALSIIPQWSTQLSHPLKVDGTILSKGSDDSKSRLMLEVWNAEKANIETYDWTKFSSSAAPNILVGLNPGIQVDPDQQIGRTFIGIADPYYDGINETVLIFTGKSLN
jgi:hypothetical protein